MTYICVSKLTIIGSDNGLSPGRHQAITWANCGILLIKPLETNLGEILIEIHIFSFKSFKKTHLNLSYAIWPTLCLCLNVLMLLSPFPWCRPEKSVNWIDWMNPIRTENMITAKQNITKPYVYFPRYTQYCLLEIDTWTIQIRKTFH